MAFTSQNQLWFSLKMRAVKYLGSRDLVYQPHRGKSLYQLHIHQCVIGKNDDINGISAALCEEVSKPNDFVTNYECNHG